MGRWLIHFFSAYLLVAGCSSIGKDHFPSSPQRLPPPYQFPLGLDDTELEKRLAQFAAQDQSLATRWWVQYHQARVWRRTDLTRSCTAFKSLAEDSLFPLQRLALLRAYEVCPLETHSQLPPIPTEDREPWLRPTALTVAIREAELTGQMEQFVNLKVEQSKLSGPIELRVQMVQEAHAAALRLERTDLVKTTKARLEQLAPRYIENPSKSEFLSVARDFRRIRDFKTARGFYRRVLADSSLPMTVRLTAHEELRRTFKLERRDDLHLQSSRDSVRFVLTQFRRNKRNKALQEALYDHHLHLARTQWTMGQKAQAIHTLEAAQKYLTGVRSLGLLYWLRGRMEEEDQAYDRAIQWYAQAMREPQVTPQFQARVAWSLAWSLGRLNRHADAALTLASNIDATGNGFERARFQFWLARFYQKSNLDDKALELFRELRDQDFLGYYGLMARRELRESLPPITELRAPASVLTANFTEIRRYLNPEIALWLAAVGESQVAKEYLDLAARSMNKAKELGLEAWLDLLRIYAQAGEYQSLIDHLGQIDFNLRQAIVRRSPELVFPTPFELVVHKSAEKFGVARELIFSIMRQESAFNPRARSHADAFGLMQVLPEVARATRPQHGIAFEKDDDLYNPDINVPIGANHLRDLRGRHRDQFILYVTSYNASEKAIAGWLKTRFREDALEFIEDIPYDETRSYVRLVMRNFVFYSMLSRPGAAMPFPEDLLRLTATVD